MRGPDGGDFWSAEELSAVTAAVRALETAYTVTMGRPVGTRRTWLDSADWRLYRAGLALSATSGADGAAGGAETLELSGADGATVTAGPDTLGWPRLLADLPGDLRPRLETVLGVRALLPVVRVSGSEVPGRLLDGEGKTVVRLVHERPATIAGSQGAAAGWAAADPAARVRRGGRPRRAPRAVRRAAPRRPLRLRGGAGGRGRRPGCPAPPGARARPSRRRRRGQGAAVLPRRDGGRLGRHGGRRRHRVPARLPGRSAAESLGGQAARRPPPGRPRRPGDAAAEVARRPHHPLPRPRRPPAGAPVAGRPAERQPGRGPGADGAPPAPAADGRAPPAGPRPALGAVRAVARPMAGLVDGAGGSGGFARTSVEEIGPERLAAAYRRVLRRGSRITPASPAEDLHDLRKRCKELRYLLETFTPLLDPGGARRAVRGSRPGAGRAGRLPGRRGAARHDLRAGHRHDGTTGRSGPDPARHRRGRGPAARGHAVVARRVRGHVRAVRAAVRGAPDGPAGPARPDTGRRRPGRLRGAGAKGVATYNIPGGVGKTRLIPAVLSLRTGSWPSGCRGNGTRWCRKRSPTWWSSSGWPANERPVPVFAPRSPATTTYEALWARCAAAWAAPAGRPGARSGRTTDPGIRVRHDHLLQAAHSRGGVLPVPIFSADAADRPSGLVPPVVPGRRARGRPQLTAAAAGTSRCSAAGSGSACSTPSRWVARVSAT